MVDLISYCLASGDANYCFIANSCAGDECSGQPTIIDADGFYILRANLPPE